MTRARLYTLAEVADDLRYEGKDRERSVRRLFDRLGVPMLRRDRNTYLVTEQQLDTIRKAITCSQSENEADFIIAAARSVSVKRPGKLKSSVQDKIKNALRKSTSTRSPEKSGGRSFTVVAGGRGA